MENSDEAIYWISKGDVQKTVSEGWGRDLSEQEMAVVADKIGDYIDWHEATLSAIGDVIGNAPDESGSKGEE